MRRRLFTFLSFLSLLLCVTTVVVCFSGRSMDGWSVVRRQTDAGAYSIRLGKSDVTLFVPPPSVPAGNNQTQAMVEQLANGHVGWRSLKRSPAADGLSPHASVLGTFTISDWTFHEYGPLADRRLAADADRPLFVALRDPQRFLAAHVLLRWRLDGRHQPFPVEVVDGRYISLDVGAWFDLGKRNRVVLAGDGGLVTADSEQVPALQRYWADRLARPVWVVPLWVVAVATALLPAWSGIQLARRWIALRRLRLAGLCLRCGYDVRASPDRCPECGTAVGAK